MKNENKKPIPGMEINEEALQQVAGGAEPKFTIEEVPDKTVKGFGSEEDLTKQKDVPLYGSLIDNDGKHELPTPEIITATPHVIP